MNTRSIRFRLVVWHAALLTGVFLVLASCIYAGVKLYLEGNLADSQLRRARQIAFSLLPDVAKTGEPYVSDEIKARFAPEANGRFVRVVRPDHTIMYQSGSPQDQTFDAGKIPLPSSLAATPSTRKELSDAARLLISTVPFPGASGTYWVEAGAPLEPVNAFLNRLLFWMGLGLPVLVAVTVVGGRLLINQALAPVQQTCRSAEQITLQNLSQRLSTTSTGDELEQLTTALNLMIGRLEDAFLHNRRFMADASHEMRTPLTIIRGELEATVRGDDISKEAKDALGSVLEEVESLTKIVDKLFAIARLDAGEVQPKWTQFDFSKLASNTAEQMMLVAEDKSISLSSEASKPVPVKGDRSRLKQVIVNLLDNAIKYTPAGGSIQVCVKATETKAVLEVTDTGIGIPQEELPHIFERFFRVDKARSRELGGAGLGLSIVKSICTAHGGTVVADSIEGQGTCFKVELPKAASLDDEETT